MTDIDNGNGALPSARAASPSGLSPASGSSQSGIANAEFFIVWNAARNEGFVTDDESDALACLRGGECSGSTAGLSFAEIYDDDERTLERHTLKALGQ